MAEFNETPVPESFKKKFFVGVEIPLPWLIGIVAALLFNAGVIWSQFSDLREQTRQFGEFAKAVNTRQDGLDRRMDATTAEQLRTSDRNNLQDSLIADHERRIRDLERGSTERRRDAYSGSVKPDISDGPSRVNR